MKFLLNIISTFVLVKSRINLNEMILVTGGTGLVGSHLLFNLLSKGHKAKVLIRPDSNKGQIYRTFSYYTPQPEKLTQLITWVEGDMLDLLSLENALADVTQVYHTAAFVSFKRKDKKSVLQTNIKGTANLVNICLEKGIGKLCHVSSIGALGQSEPEMQITEDLLWKPSKNSSVYSLSKYHSEMEVWRGITEGLNAVIVNPSVVLGPGNWEKGSPSFFKLIDRGFKYYTEGVTGYLDVRDLAEIMVQLMESNITGERFIVSAENLSYRQFLTTISDALGRPSPYQSISRRQAGIYAVFEAIKSAMFGKEPRMTKEAVHIAFAKSYYDNNKLGKILPYAYRPISQSVKDIATMYKATHT